MNTILERFRQRGFESGGELYLSPAEARDLLAALREGDFAILGVEAVHLENGKIVPQLDQIADFSSLSTREWRDHVQASSKAAAAFLQQLPRDPSIMVTFNTISRSEARG